MGAEDGEKMAREYSAIFMETSSKDGQNILDSLVLLAREMCSNEDVEVQTSTLLIRLLRTFMLFFRSDRISSFYIVGLSVGWLLILCCETDKF